MVMLSSALSAFGKVLQGKNLVENQRKEVGGLISKIPMVKTAGGDEWTLPVQVRNAAGLGTTVAQAQANAAGTGGHSRGIKYRGDFGTYFGGIYFNYVDQKILTGQTEGSIIDQKVKEAQDLHFSFLSRAAELLYSDAGMSLAFGAFSAGTITFTDVTRSSFFEVGMVLEASANDGTAAGHTKFAGKGYIIAVNKNAGTITVSATDGGAAGTPSGWTGNMYVFPEGQFGGASPTRWFMPLGGWIPRTDPSGGESFFGIDRSPYASIAAGLRLTTSDVQGLDDASRIIELCIRIGTRNQRKRPNTVVVNSERFIRIARQLNPQKFQDGAKATVVTGSSDIQFFIPGGVVTLIGDDYCGFYDAWALNVGSGDDGVHFKYIGDDFIEVVNDDSLTVTRGATTNDLEMRFSSIAQLFVPNTASCGRVTLS